ncbi:serine/threonine protein kinase [Penguinpox virus]|uniref:non-specific serine/threonine protein kinase n=1 Tax=Penguinpox virus TaxID=648998 RepID=A0A068EH83_9POXV|nr:serine/threonine protein kinase [Penguinpox virus]AID46950.1 serine/threonine protein kinase [Penguinpox virus]
MRKNNVLSFYLPEGTLIEDIGKKDKWIIGKQLGYGGFGIVYQVSYDSKEIDCVAKIELRDSSTLYCEINFYIRVMKDKTSLDTWMKEQRVDYIGIPSFHGFGFTTYNEVEYRFVIIQRLGKDLENVLAEKGKINISLIKKLAIKLLDILKFIHSRGFSHGDIKASNILFDKDDDKVYLADYGLATKYSYDGKHKEYTIDPKSRHNGTIAFTSIDAHKGVTVSRRGDLESLGFCMLKWYSGKLPWEKYEKEPENVQCMKEVFVSNITRKNIPAENAGIIYNYIKVVTKLEYEETPNYESLKQMFL